MHSQSTPDGEDATMMQMALQSEGDLYVVSIRGPLSMTRKELMGSLRAALGYHAVAAGLPVESVLTGTRIVEREEVPAITN